MIDLGTIEQVALREVWPHEAANFTPWLADNLDRLGEALGLELDLQSAEAAVGAFSLDILARDLGSGRPVIIENQLEETNHDHLGKLLTYAAGYDAYAAVWLVRGFRDEHRQALDWLNQRTGEDTAFFGVVVEAIRIDGSRPASQFRVVAMPNDWRKKTVTDGGDKVTNGTGSERQERYLEFFQSLVDTLRDEYRFTNSKNARPQNWFAFRSGSPGVRYSATFMIGGRYRVEVYIDRGDREQTKRLFDSLEQRKENIETELNEPLEWDRLENRQASRISVVREGSINDDDDTLEEIRQWMVERLLAFKRVFTPHLQELVE